MPASAANAVSNFEFVLNGSPVRVEGVAPTTTLLAFLRDHGHTGSKRGCDEGDCGACTVAIVEHDAFGKPTYRAINSCIALLPMFAGREVVTVEGLASGGKLHPVQNCMVDHYGSQCGYCTPGFVVSLFEGYHRGDCRTPEKIADQLCGNLCRCTGYRPIRDAALAAFQQADEEKTPVDAHRARLARPVKAPGALDYVAEGDRFFRPGSWNELFAVWQAFPDAKLVAGATEIGVELNKKAKPFPRLISTEGVPELTRIVRTDAAWRIGGAATLTAIEETVASEFPALGKMLRVFASRQIRNRATLGGNLATASPIGDSAPVLLTLDAELLLASAGGERTVKLADFFVGYRKTALAANELIKEIVVPRSGPAAGLTRRVDFLKVSKRRELDISIVAGAFLADCDASGTVRRARLAYGGVAVTPTRARHAEAALEGKTFAAAAREVTERLREAFQPIDDARGGAAYRRELVVSLWEKFSVGEASAAQDGALDFEKGLRWENDDASRALPHESGAGHVTGGAEYADDLAHRRPMLDVWPVMAPHARAKIKRRDAAKARRAPGVVAVLVAEDVPGHNLIGPVRHDEPLFATDEILYHGQLVALVVGESLKACRAAAALVEVEYEPLAPICTIAEAMAQQSFHTDPHTLARGDCATALAGAPLRLEGEFELGGQEHFYLETQAAWAEPVDNGCLFVCSSTQHPSEIHAIVSEVLGLSRNKVVTQSPRMGGGFGGKETQGNPFAALVALAAMKTGKPVRLQLDRDVDLIMTGKRHPFHAKFSVGYDGDGLLRAADVELVSNGGYSLDLSQAIADRALFHLDNAYYIPAARFSARVAKTNLASNTAFRGFGGPQGMLVMEEILDRIARRLGLTPEIVRERNLYRGTGETNTTHFFEDIGDNRIQDCWHGVLKQADFAARRTEITAWNRAHSRVKRGIAVTPVKFGISFTHIPYNQGGALVLIYSDGTVQVNHGGTEMGQGLHTKVLGVAMRELGLPASSIRLMPTSTDKVPNTSATAASAGADLNGAAVAAACVTLRERLAPIAAAMLSENVGAASRRDPTRTDAENRGVKPLLQPEDVVFAHGCVAERGNANNKVPFAKVCGRAYLERISLSATGYYRTPGIHWDWNEAAGRPFHYFACGAAVSEVEVDGYTGMHRVRRVDILHDVGESLNPGVDRGQIEGGFVQGMGWLTREELLWDKTGRLLTHSASTYQIPAISDAPADFRVTLLPNASQPNVIHGSKAVGEPPLMLAISVREAIRDAVAAFGTAGGEVALASPATSEAIFTAIRQRTSGL